MDTTLDVFKAEQQKSANLLRSLLSFINEGKDLGIELADGFALKLSHAIGSVVGERLKVALVGGFSEGKTSIAAAWMNRLDREGMSISQSESTEEVREYRVKDDLLLIDTPGLFGFRETDGRSYRDITRQYVSEANLVLYVMDPTNPIKESHKAELAWLLRDLSLLSRTVFVLSRFDAVADLEDEAAYQAALATKRFSVRQRLQELIGLEGQEADDLSVVAVSANPFDQGLDYWLENPDQHRQLSRIGSLQSATAEKIRVSGGTVRLVSDTRRAIIADVLGEYLPVAVEQSHRIADEVERLADAVKELTAKLDLANRHALDAANEIREFLITYFPALILQAEGADMETWNEFFEREVGDEGVVIRMRIQQVYSSHLRAVQMNLEGVQKSIVEEVNHFNTMVSSKGRLGVQFLLDSKIINNSSIISVRNGLVSAGKMIGLDLKDSLKFAPWGAIKLAKGLNAGLPAIGVALELWESYSASQRESKFRDGVSEFVGMIKAQQKGLADDLADTGPEGAFFRTYCPDLLEMREVLTELRTSLADMDAKRQRFLEWHQRAKSLDVEFRQLKAG